MTVTSFNSKLLQLSLLVFPLLSTVLSLGSLTLPQLSDIHNDRTEDQLFNTFLPNLLVPRVAGSDGNKKVRQFILQHYTDMGWHIEQDTFNDTTPIGQIEFSNVVATKHPTAPYRIVLAAHYDSKFFTDFEFIGATDSSAPCALLLDLCQSVDHLLNRLGGPGSGLTPNVTLQVVFFDGEEAFKDWTPTDSIYGARHLASKWETERKLKNITALVLLDLLGSQDTHLVNFFSETAYLFQRLFDVQQFLSGLNLLQATTNKKSPNSGIVDPKSMGGGIEDDHIPFLRRSVPILHLISYPFPSVWHREEDNAKALDNATIKDLSLTMKIFIADYLSLWNPSGNQVQQSSASSLTKGTSPQVTPSVVQTTPIEGSFSLPGPLFAFFVVILVASLGVNALLFYKVRKMKYQKITSPTAE